MINVEVKYYGKPVMLDKRTHKIKKYIRNYKIDEYIKAEDLYEDSQVTIRKEVTQIFKRCKGIYSIKFHVNGVNE